MKTTVSLAFISIALSFVSMVSADTLRTVAFTGDVAPGTEASFSVLGFPVLNIAGQTAFSSSLGGSGVNDTNDRGMWSEGKGSLALIAREGSAAPGTSATFLALGGPVLNNAGQIAFPGLLTGNGVRFRDPGIWSEGSGALALVAREGSAAPGTSSVFFRFEFPVILNSKGQTAFAGRVANTGINNINDGIWSEGSGSLALVVREGDGAPGTNGSFGAFGFANRPLLNDAGQIAFLGRLVGPASNSGIWTNRNGLLALVAGVGNNAPGTDGSFSFFTSPPALNNAGQIAFFAFFVGPGVTDGSDMGVWAERGGSLTLVAREGDEAPGTSASFSILSVPVIRAC